MIQKTIKVKEATTLPTKSGKATYLSVVLSDGPKKYSVFNSDLQKVLQGAHKSGESLNVGLEQEGNFWNVKTAVVTSEEVVAKQGAEPQSTGQRYYHDRHSQDAEDWTNIRTATMQAVELHTHQPPQGNVDVKGVMQSASEIFADMCMMKPNRETK